MSERLARTDAGSLYSAACFRAVTAGLFKDRSGDAKAEADRAIAWLKQAVAAGFKDRTRMEKDSDLDVLRARDDFKALLDSLSKDKTEEAAAKRARESWTEARCVAGNAGAFSPQ
jgi:hypothetical protein